jgi:excisionase family DNA binding protein
MSKRNIPPPSKGAKIMEEWVTMTEAAERLGVPLSQISRLASRGEIRSEADTVNRRVKLVEFNEVKAIFEKSKYYRKDR